MKRKAVVEKNRCAACGACTKVCPRDALSVFRGCYAVADENKCVGCGLCSKICPAGCISVTERSEVK